MSTTTTEKRGAFDERGSANEPLDILSSPERQTTDKSQTQAGQSDSASGRRPEAEMDYRKMRTESKSHHASKKGSKAERKAEIDRI
jgi:hypothetical protein